ncbi:GntR family transcriptional regulator [Roseovarius aestuarii]|nr:GntR family transcriptional regulator [Roseovarius aestuarii]
MSKKDNSSDDKAGPSRTERVRQALRHAIIDQKLTPGVRLPEDAIAESFGTSRTIAREALGRLAVEGLVDLQPNRGAFVAHPTPEEGQDIFVVRRALERAIVEDLVGNISAKDADYLRAMVAEESTRSDDDADAIRLSGEFHLELARMTGNKLLVRYMTEVVSRCSLVLAIYGRAHSAYCGACEHAEIVEALIAGTRDKALKLMDTHLSDVANRAVLTVRNKGDIRDVLAAYAKKLK